MSFEVKPDAYKTKLGNPTAKNVLALIADQVNVDGLGWPSVEYIADRTEVNLRTVLRMIQVFTEIRLIKKTRTERFGKTVPALQVNLARLGTDLRAEFATAYAKAQSKGGDGAPGECRRDTVESVAETAEGVAETQKTWRRAAVCTGTHIDL